MTYSTTVPASTDAINTTYAPIAANFSIIDTTFGEDHVPPTNATSANWGKHKWATLQQQSGVPSPTGALTATDSLLYSRATSGVSQLFFNDQTNVQQLSTTRAFGIWIANGTLQGPHFGISSITLVGTSPNQYWQVNFSPTLPSTNYAVQVSMDLNTTGTYTVRYTSRTTTTCLVQVVSTNGNYRNDVVNSLSILVYGG